MIRVNEIKFRLEEPLSKEAVLRKLSGKLKIKPEMILSYQIVRESVDARKGIQYTYTIDVAVKNERYLLDKGFVLAPKPFVPIDLREPYCHKKNEEKSDRPVVIGFGPAGLFAALQLARAGLKPIVIEKGEPVEIRTKTVDRFWREGVLNPNSNVQFGEGGAGTFSDGKLTTRIKDARIEFVISQLIEFGAPNEISYKNKPHIGTDVLKGVVRNIRNHILSLGGEIRFKTEVVDIIMDSQLSEIKGVKCSDGNDLETSHVIAAVGHSARQFYEMLLKNGIKMEQKPFAVGLRIEHPQEIINSAQYGMAYKNPKLGAAEYKLTYQTSKGRSVYSFCMCPGGEVVGAASELGGLVVNGMSYQSRNLPNANSALLVNVMPTDLGSDHVLAGIEFQRSLEKRAFEMGGSSYKAPIQLVGDFLGGPTVCDSVSKVYGEWAEVEFDALKPSHRFGTKPVDLKALLPKFIWEAIEEALPEFNKKIKGFSDRRAVLTGVESRSSSPVRIMRNTESLESISLKGFFPSGEGAGYSGGITSSAVDGLKCAEKVIESLLIN